jgi:hypothetical protein
LNALKKFARTRPIVLFVALVAIAGGVVAIVLALSGGDDGKKNAHELKDPNPQHQGFDLRAAPDRFAGPPPLKVKFTTKPFDNEGDVKYSWIFDDGTTSQEQSPAHTFAKSGYYEVTVRGRDAKGNQTAWTMVLGVWPKKAWTEGQRGRPLGKTLSAVRQQTRRTEKRRKELSAKGLPVFEGTSVKPGTYARQQRRKHAAQQ